MTLKSARARERRGGTDAAHMSRRGEHGAVHAVRDVGGRAAGARPLDAEQDSTGAGGGASERQVVHGDTSRVGDALAVEQSPDDLDALAQAAQRAS